MNLPNPSSSFADSAKPNIKAIQENPEYFGSYLMMARHNIFLIANNIAEKFEHLGLKKLSDDAGIYFDSSTDSYSPLIEVFDLTKPYFEDYKDRIYHYTKRFLPFVKIFSGEDMPKQKIPAGTPKPEPTNIDFTRLHHFLSISFKHLSGFRDAFAHYLAFDNVTREIVHRNTLLDNSIREDIEVLFEQAPLYSYFNFTSTQEGVADTHNPEDFFHLNRTRIFEEGSSMLTPHGFYFFICLFLEKRYAIKFLKKLQGFKSSSTPMFRATLNAYTAYSVKLPHEKLISDDPQQAILLDMLNELNKCPTELFNHLTEEGKKSFEADSDDEAINNIIQNLNVENFSDDNQLEDHLINMRTLRRNEDRFPYFALRFLEQSAEFGAKVKFQIRLGKILLRSYPKTILNTIVDRRISKEVNAFGHLQDFTNEDRTLLSILHDDTISNVHFEQYVPHYNIASNKIGFIFSGEPNVPTFNAENGKIEQSAPDAFLSIHELPKLALLELLKPGKADQTIYNYFKTVRNSIYNQEKLQLIRDKVTYEPITLTRRVENQYKNFKITKGELAKRKEYCQLLKLRREQLSASGWLRIVPTQLPARVANYLMHIDEAASHKADHITVARLKNEVKARNKALAAGRTPKIGEMATYIAKDIIAMIVSPELKAHFTSVYYGKLQNKIAYFSIQCESVIELLNELDVFTAKGHPFLMREHIANSSSVRGLYETYLTAKQQWIMRTFVSTKGGKTIQSIPADKPLPYTLKRQTETSFPEYLENKKSLPVELPVNLLDEVLIEVLKNKLEEKGISDINPKARFSVLLAQYLNDDSQPCYAKQRAYKIRHTLKPINPARTLKPVYEVQEVRFMPQGLDSKALKKKYGAYAESNEKNIRFHQTKDRIIRMICEQVLSKSKVSISDALRLAQIYPNSSQSPLNMPAVFRQAYSSAKAEKKETAHVIIASNSGDNSEGYEWTLRDYGTFRRILHDKRLKNLFTYFPKGSNIPYALIKHELEQYDIYRERLLDCVFCLERCIAGHDLEGIEKEDKNIKDGAQMILLTKRPSKVIESFPQVQFEVYAEWMIKHGIVFNRDVLEKIRNVFAHTQYPEQEVTGLPLITQDEQDKFALHQKEAGFKQNFPSIAARVYLLFEMEVEQILNQIRG